MGKFNKDLNVRTWANHYGPPIGSSHLKKMAFVYTIILCKITSSLVWSVKLGVKVQVIVTFMAMGMKLLLNTPMNFGPMILISWVGRFYAYFVTLKRRQLKSHEFCLSLNPKTHFFNKSCKEVPIIWMFFKTTKKTR
jgi:hypothetical protein